MERLAKVTGLPAPRMRIPYVVDWYRAHPVAQAKAA